jgi:hypothetical protein
MWGEKATPEPLVSTKVPEGPARPQQVLCGYKRLWCSLFTSHAFIFVHLLSHVSLLQLLLCGPFTFMSIYFFINPEQLVIYFCSGFMLLKKGPYQFLIHWNSQVVPSMWTVLNVPIGKHGVVVFWLGQLTGDLSLGLSKHYLVVYPKGASFVETHSCVNSDDDGDRARQLYFPWTRYVDACKYMYKFNRLNNYTNKYFIPILQTRVRPRRGLILDLWSRSQS